MISGFPQLTQNEVIGDVEVHPAFCASGSVNCGNGQSGLIAVDGAGQLLVGIRLRDDVRAPTEPSTTGGVTFALSPTYAAELQRLSPAPAGTRWVGYISPTINYTTAGGPQTGRLRLLLGLERPADGGPYRGGVSSAMFVGSRLVTPTASPSRPVTCGSSLTTVNNADTTICGDGSGGFGTGTRDLGILAAPAQAVVQGGLATFAFPLRYAGVSSPQANFSLSAGSTLPGGLYAVTPDAYQPPNEGSAEARVAVGVPAGARPGSYDVTLTARLGGQVRTATATLTVREAPAGAGAGGAGPAAGPAAARLRVTTILPRRLSAAAARRRGIVVLIGSSRAGPARVRLFQGPARRPRAAKAVRLKAPGPVRVVLRSAALTRGRYRVVVRAEGRDFVARSALAR